MFDKNTPAIEQVLERGLTQSFDVNPSTTGNKDEAANLVRYLRNQVLTVDAWDGND